MDSYIEQIECLETLTRNIEVESERGPSVDEDVRLLLSLTDVGVYSALIIKSKVGGISGLS